MIQHELRDAFAGVWCFTYTPWLNEISQLGDVNDG